MADNYLERKMEEYRRQRPAATHCTPSYRGAASAPLPLPGVRVLVDAGMDVPVPEVVVALVNAGCRVAFRCSDAAAGNRLAQSCGARALPLERARALQNLFKAWGGVDILIVGDSDTDYAAEALSRCRPGRGRVLTIGGLTAETVVRKCS